MKLPDGFITRKDALELMRKKDRDEFPVPFTLRFVTCDIKRKTGGELREVRAILPHGGINPSMWRHATRNIQLLGKHRERVAVHVYLMTKINGLTIL